MSNQLTPNMLRIGLSLKHPTLEAQEFNDDMQSNSFMVEYVIATTMGIKLKKDIYQRLQNYHATEDFFQISKEEILSILTREFHLFISTIDKMVCDKTNLHYGSKLNHLITLCDHLERNVFDFFRPMFIHQHVDIFVSEYQNKKYVSFIPVEKENESSCCLDIHGHE